jgi:hypothetical protein
VSTFATHYWLFIAHGWSDDAAHELALIAQVSERQLPRCAESGFSGLGSNGDRERRIEMTY